MMMIIKLFFIIGIIFFIISVDYEHNIMRNLYPIFELFDVENIKRYPENNNINLLQDNYFKKECCPSSVYTSINGCLCDNEYINDILETKGGNRSL